MSKFILFLLMTTTCSLGNAAPVDKRFARDQQVVLRQLKKLQNSDPKRELQTASAKKDFRFLGVRGFSTEVFGVRGGIINRIVQRYGVNPIEGTGDFVFSPEQEKLQNLAIKYSKCYNQLLLQKLKHIRK